MTCKSRDQTLVKCVYFRLSIAKPFDINVSLQSGIVRIIFTDKIVRNTGGIVRIKCTGKE